MLSIQCIGFASVFAKAYFRQLKILRKGFFSTLHSLQVRPGDCSVSESNRQLPMGNYWLLKTEPDCWSWDNQRDNKGLSVWDGVRNHLAQKAMRNMVEGDLCFFYHTGKLKEVCGIVRVVKEFYPDPTDDTGKWGAVDVREVLPMKSNVTLAQMKADDEIGNFLMFRQPRLSVVPVEEKVWTRVCTMGEVEPPLVDSSGHIEEKSEASNGSEKLAAEPKVARVAKQSKKRVGRGRKEAADDDGESEGPSNVAKERSSQAKAKAKATAVVKEVKSKTTTAKAKTGANGSDSGRTSRPSRVVTKRGVESKPVTEEEEKEVPSSKATKKRASQAKSVSFSKKGEIRPSRTSSRLSKKLKTDDET